MAADVRRVLVAPDKFKGSLSAPEVARCLSQGLGEGAPAIEAVQLPVADGGDGTVAALENAGFDTRTIEVEGPVGTPVVARIAVRDQLAVVEMAQTSGLALLGEHGPAPMRASSYGLGQAIVAALDLGCRELIVGIGGSASTDGGAGMLQALGARLDDGRGRPIGRGATGLQHLQRVDLGPARRRLDGVRVVAACDVSNPLLGEHGAAREYAPQKGASPDQVRRLERWLQDLSALLVGGGAPDVAGEAGAGAAGGVGYALLSVGATFRRGVELLLDVLDFGAAAADAQLVITGEGSLDEQSLNGKAPVGVAAAAGRRGLPVVAVAGRSTLTDGQLRAAGFARVYTLAELEPDPAASMAGAAGLLRAVGQRIARDAGELAR